MRVNRHRAGVLLQVGKGIQTLLAGMMRAMKVLVASVVEGLRVRGCKRAGIDVTAPRDER